MPEIVARRVFAVLPELHRLPVVRAAVHAGQEPFDDMACAKLQSRDLLDRLRMQKSF
jgi:hypothetical protein